MGLAVGELGGRVFLCSEAQRTGTCVLHAWGKNEGCQAWLVQYSPWDLLAEPTRERTR